MSGFTDLSHECSHLQSQLLVHREVALMDFIIHLVGQQEALSLCLTFHLRSETQPAKTTEDQRRDAGFPGRIQGRIFLQIIWF